MGETVKIETRTGISKANGTITIGTYYTGGSLSGVQTFISTGPMNIDGVLFEEGELGVIVFDSSSSQNIYFSINEQGEMIAHGPLSGSFSIVDGELIYTES